MALAVFLVINHQEIKLTSLISSTKISEEASDQTLSNESEHRRRGFKSPHQTRQDLRTSRERLVVHRHQIGHSKLQAKATKAIKAIKATKVTATRDIKTIKPGHRLISSNQLDVSWDNRQPRFSSQRAYQATATDEEPEEGFDEYDQSSGYWQYHDNDAAPPEQSTEEAYHNNDNWEYEYDEPESSQQETSDVIFVQPAKPTDHHCHLCCKAFSSRNKLFQHLKESCWNTQTSELAVKPDAAKPDDATVEANFASASFVIKSKAIPDKSKQPGFGFRGWKYATIKVQWTGTKYSSNSEEVTEVCLNTGCSVTLIYRRTYLEKVLLKAEIKKMSTPMPVRGVGNRLSELMSMLTSKCSSPGKRMGKKQWGPLSWRPILSMT